MSVRRFRRALVVGAGVLSTGVTAAWTYEPMSSGPAVTVYKTPSCGCCRKWVDHLRDHGFRVTTRDMEDVQPVKRRHHVPGEAASCHTALVGGYVVEGHVPADVIQKLLRERPRVTGIAVPGMPMGSPGMEGPYKQRYDVLSFDHTGKTAVYVRR